MDYSRLRRLSQESGFQKHHCANRTEPRETSSHAPTPAPIAGSPAVTLRQGETFYENPTDIHLVSANASTTAPAKILVFIVTNKGAPVSRDVPSKAAP